MSQNVKPIVITDNETGMEYTLEFTRESVRFAEQRGFDIRDVGKFPMTKIPELWFYAFRAHHKGLSRGQTDTLLEKVGALGEEVMTRLGELYAAPFSYMLDDEAAVENPRATVSL